MSKAIKTVDLGANGSIQVTYTANWLSGANIDGHQVDTPRKLVVTCDVVLGANAHLRKLRHGSHHDDNLIAKGAAAVIGSQMIGQATYDKVCAAIEAAKAEVLDAEMLGYIAKQKAAEEAADKAAAEYDAHHNAVKKMMEE